MTNAKIEDDDRAIDERQSPVLIVDRVPLALEEEF